MPIDIVDVDISNQTAAVAQETYNDILVVGSSTTAPAQGFNRPTWYTDPSAVSEDVAAGSDVHTASQYLDAMGVEQWLVVVLEETTYTDLIADSDTTATQSGTVNTTPVAGNADVTISVDGTDQNVVPVTDSPPNANETPAAGEALFNYDTGEVYTGTATSGAGAGLEVSYSSLSWADAFTSLQDYDPDVGILADTNVGVPNVGDADELITWGAGHGMAVVLAGPNGNDFASDESAMETYHDVSSYVQSGNTLMFAHKSPEDAAAYVAGQFGVEPSWHDPLYYGEGYPGLTTDYYRDSLVGEPGQNGTFEGGESGTGAGPVNVLIPVQGTTVLSNSLTTAGDGSGYQYIDVWRTEQFITDEAERALVSLSLNQDKIPYNSSGRVLIDDALKGNLMQYRGGGDQPFAELSVNVPNYDDLSEDRRANRIWGPIQITGRISSNAHQFSVEFSTKV